MKTTAIVELVFIPSPGMGHLVSAVEMAKQLVGRDDRLSITVLIMKRPFDKSKVSSSTQSLLLMAAEDRLKFIYLPLDEAAAAELQSKFPETFMLEFIKMNKQHVRDHVREMVSTGSTRIAGFVVDMFCTPMMDVAAEFGVPSYAFFTSNATVLALAFHLESLSPDEYRDLTELKDSDAELELPGFVNPVPVKVLPASFRDREFGSRFMSVAKRLRQTKGIMVNTFEELESNAVRFLAENDKIPPVYPVGPVIHLVSNTNGEEEEEAMEIMSWLDNQPLSSVVFLCFGSMGSFGGDQLKEIAQALEQSGHRFLWSVRRPPSKGKREIPDEYQDLNQVLPDGFLEHTNEIGKVIGWAPQVAILSHKAVGGFVSHCGWNSTLESLWCGVPMAAWPMHAEQQTNAFQLVRELRLAVDIKLDYKKDIFMSDSSNVMLVTVEEIENGIRKLMESENKCGEERKKRVKEMSEKSKVAVVEGGSSHNSIGLLIEDFMKTT
ncbi:hypothetical protein RHMOL_Rhmol04G0116300 [Rhododendron molle]|uniref:Uncharacterized protein n=1 Tax=Rhododendron molle TaxID=49168 RepID=A0ACC0NZN5_RHOML|nr:hypothetical protein RHMOL_Rhmol04G0116300 [Rhododendron molle]